MAGLLVGGRRQGSRAKDDDVVPALEKVPVFKGSTPSEFHANDAITL